MPKETSRRIQRHFAPLTTRSTFRPEIKSRGPLHSSRVVYPLVEVPALIPPEDNKDPTAPKEPVPKPSGEVGRIKRNGYNLKTFLCNIGWTADEYNDVQKCMRELAKAHLNTDEILTKQSKKALSKVNDLAKKAYPDKLTNFENDWAIDDFLGSILKNSSSRAKRRSHKSSPEKNGNGEDDRSSDEDEETEES
ncbi:hypothetical protein SCHPADRAFT_1002982 [Schizopora paradoxa]|uniref:Uncharacterized protein n=1 Tax=Schizopora paradoxa TaxID=27342 RepID=A0A0H2R739_9AGAM|nr:hypothetical protein SCHPADRAFT_1002982 [Schizopora paradoxa]